MKSAQNHLFNPNFLDEILYESKPDNNDLQKKILKNYQEESKLAYERNLI